MTIEERASRIRLLLFDVDGVLTDGVVIMHADGTESKGFHIRDGAVLVWAQRSGVPVGLLSSRASGATAQRAAQLAIRLRGRGGGGGVAAGGGARSVPPGRGRPGPRGAPADAAPEVRAAVHWVGQS